MDGDGEYCKLSLFQINLNCCSLSQQDHNVVVLESKMPGGGGGSTAGLGLDQLTKFVLEPGPEECAVKCRITRNCKGIDKGDACCHRCHCTVNMKEIGSMGMHFFFMVSLFLKWIIGSFETHFELFSLLYFESFVVVTISWTYLHFYTFFGPKLAFETQVANNN